jgi:hypothetical protein
METNWFIIILIVAAAVAVAVILIVRNQKDEKELEKTLIEEDEMPLKADDETDVDTEEP